MALGESTSPAQPPPDTAQSPIGSLAIESQKLAINRIRAELRTFSERMSRRLAELALNKVTPEMVEQAWLDAEATRLQVESLGLDLADTRCRIERIGRTIQALQAQEQWLANPVREEAATARAAELDRVRQQLTQERRLLGQAKDRLETVQEYGELARFRSGLAEQWLGGMREAFRLQQEQYRRTEQEAREEQLQTEQQTYLAKAAQLRERLMRAGDSLAESDRRWLETEMKLAETRARLLQHDIRLSGIENDLVSLEALVAQSDASPEELQDGLQALRDLLDEIKATQKLFDESRPLAERQKRLIEQRRRLMGAGDRADSAGEKGIGEMLVELQRRREWIAQLLTRANTLRSALAENYQISLHRALAALSHLPATRDEWRELLQHLADTPKAVFYQVTLSGKTAMQTVVQAEPTRWKLLVIAEVFLLGLTVWALRVLDRGIEAAFERESQRFVGQAFLALLRVLRSNLLGIGLVGGILMALWITQVPQPGQGIVAGLALLWIGIKTFLSLVHQLLASLRLSADRQQHSGLFTRLRWVVVVGGLLGSIVLLTHLSSLPADVRDALDRVFMLYLLLAFPVLLQLRHFLVDLLSERYAKRLWFSTLRVATFLLPLALLGTGLLGLAGYLTLAWAFAWHLGALLLVMVGWQMTRGLLSDLVVFMKNFAVTHSAYGLLWTQDIIAPLHRVLELLLFGIAWLVLLGVYGLEGDATLIDTLGHILEKPLFSVGDTAISWSHILWTLLVLLIVIGLGRWVRGITYRWIFLRIHDLGVRHSLSVFLQYAVVLTGVLLILRSIGLDLTAFAVFAGAVGVGIGFGLKEIANNLVSGLLLLLERPLRSGDIVRIGANEGTVSEIGIRAVTMKTFDNMEVIIPNSEVVSNSFTNWTHSDAIVRTVLMVGVSYDAEPERAKDILEGVIANHPAIVGEPPPWVLLWEFADSSIRFRVQYSVDVSRYSLLITRSEVNFAIWQALKKAGIRIPYPQQDLYIKEWPGRAAGDQPTEVPASQPVAAKALSARS